MRKRASNWEVLKKFSPGGFKKAGGNTGLKKLGWFGGISRRGRRKVLRIFQKFWRGCWKYPCNEGLTGIGKNPFTGSERNWGANPLGWEF